MTDSSSSSSDSSSTETSLTAGLPENFVISLLPDDFITIYGAAVRFASVPVGADTVDVAFSADHCRWWFQERNVHSYLEYPAEDEELDGAVTLPVYLLKAIADSKLAADETNVELEIDTKQQTITYTINDCTSVVPLPHQRLSCKVDIPGRTHRIIVQVPQLSQIAPLLTSIPVYLPDELDETMATEFPFINFSYDGTDLVVTRDWSRFHGPTLTVKIPAGGDYRGSFSLFGEVVARELDQIDSYSHGVFTFEFNEETPNLCHMKAGDFGMVVELGHEFVYRSRLQLEVALSAGDADIEVIRDSRIAWNSVVTVNAGERTVTATITPDDTGEAKYVRLNTDIVSNLSWSTELATEINAWNNQWPSVKLVFTDGVLHAVADVPIGAIAGISDSVVDLVAKAQIVDELIAAVL